MSENDVSQSNERCGHVFCFRGACYLIHICVVYPNLAIVVPMLQKIINKPRFSKCPNLQETRDFIANALPEETNNSPIEEKLTS